MPSPSNLYAEKIFSEHPLSLWTLDEEFENGATGQTVSDIKNVSSFKGIKASAYGKTTDFGWYVGNSLLNYYADNSGVPMVFGAANVTGLYPNDTTGQPSLLIPGKGFLNASAKYRDLTLEFWLRATANTSNGPFRIVGPVASKDGIYIDGSFIKIKIGDNVASHFVAEWQRPMLIQFTTTKTGATLLINGDQVASMRYDVSKISLPSTMSSDNKEQDWIGFYLDATQVPLVDVDCVAIYPSIVPEVLAKRRFAYGQAVQYPQNLLSNYGGSAVIMDYSFANYAKNFNYPNMARWDGGTLNNVIAKGNFLTVPDYKLPDLVSTKNNILITSSVWNSDNLSIQSGSDLFFCTKPNSEYSNSYIKFNSLNILNGVPKAIFGLFKTSSTIDTKELLLKIYNNFSGKYIEISATKSATTTAAIVTKYFDGTDLNTLDTKTITINSTKFVAGIDLETFASSGLSGASNFFNNISNISMYVGGDESGLYQYTGKIFKVFFADTVSFSKFSAVSSNTNGSLSASNPSILNLNASYTLMPKKIGDSFYLDIGIDGFWQDYVPLSALTQKIDTGDYDLEFIQFNVGYHSTKQYDTDHFATSSDFKAYASFQTIESGAQANPSISVLMDNNLVVQPTSSWQVQKYEVFDNTIIYPPDVADIETLALVIRFDFSIDGILGNPFTIKSLQIASQAFNVNSANTIGTRYGVNLIPYQPSGTKNPFLIYKDSTPYLYMTDKSGIRLCGTLSNDMTRGIKIAVNSASAPSYNVSSIQMFIKYNDVAFKEKEPFFEIRNKKPGYERIKFYTFANPGNKTAQIKGYVVNSDNTETLISGINYYLDGHKIADTQNPQIELNEWHIFDVNFPKLLDFGDSTNYSINLTGPEVFNNISYYRVSDNAIQQKTKKVSWQSILQTGSTTNTWSTWNSQTWSDVLYEEFQDVESINPETVYNIYLGVNKIIVDTDRPQDKLAINGYQYSIYSDVSWQSEVIKPV